MTPERIDRIRAIVWTTILLMACAVTSAAFWLAQQVWLLVGPWLTAHIEGVFVFVAITCAACVAVMAKGDRR
jgi:hypothetical protein